MNLGPTWAVVTSSGGRGHVGPSVDASTASTGLTDLEVLHELFLCEGEDYDRSLRVRMRLLEVRHRPLARLFHPLGPFHADQTQFSLLQIEHFLELVVLPLKSVDLLVEVLDLGVLDVFLGLQVIDVQPKLLFGPDVVAYLGFVFLHELFEVGVLATDLLGRTTVAGVKPLVPELRDAGRHMFDHLVEHQVDVLHRIDADDFIAVAVHQCFLSSQVL